MRISRLSKFFSIFLILGISFLHSAHGQDAPAQGSGSLQDQLTRQQEEIRRLTEDLRKIKEEADVRGQLEMKPEEKKSAEENLLDAAGREYTLLPPGLIGLEYQFSYSYYSADAITYNKEQARSKIEHDANHNINQSLVIDYPVLNNLTANLSLSFSSRFDKSGPEESMEKSDFGDISVGVQWQPFSSSGGQAASIFFANAAFPTGKSPYETVLGEELSTGGGLYLFSGGVSLSRSAGSVMLFGGLNYSHALPVDDLNQKYGKNSEGQDIILRQVKTGDRFGGQCGVSWSMTYDVSMNLSYQYAYGLESEYVWSDWSTASTQSSASSILGFGVGWRVKPETSINLKILAGLTNEDPDFMVSFRLPFQFSL